MIKNICKTCEITFEKPSNPTRVYKYCSVVCNARNPKRIELYSKKMKGKKAWNKGDIGIKEWHNISGLNKGIPWNKGTKGSQIAWNKGVPNPSFSGENNPMWKGGVTSINEKIRKSIEYKQWRTSVYVKDNYTCVECGNNRGGNLEADHIKQFAFYPELRFDVSNGRTLCKECHKKTDTYLNKGRWAAERSKWIILAAV